MESKEREENCPANTEYVHPVLSLLRFIQEHLECIVTARIDGQRILADCERCCHSRNIPLGSIESFFRTALRLILEHCGLRESTEV